MFELHLSAAELQSARAARSDEHLTDLHLGGEAQGIGLCSAIGNDRFTTHRPNGLDNGLGRGRTRTKASLNRVRVCTPPHPQQLPFARQTRQSLIHSGP